MNNSTSNLTLKEYRRLSFSLIMFPKPLTYFKPYSFVSGESSIVILHGKLSPRVNVIKQHIDGSENRVITLKYYRGNGVGL